MLSMILDWDSILCFHDLWFNFDKFKAGFLSNSEMDFNEINSRRCLRASPLA